MIAVPRVQRKPNLLLAPEKNTVLNNIWPNSVQIVGPWGSSPEKPKPNHCRALLIAKPLDPEILRNSIVVFCQPFTHFKTLIRQYLSAIGL